MTDDMPEIPAGGKFLIKIGVGMIALIVLLLCTFSLHTVPGNMVGVKETFSGGVEPDPLPARTYFLFRPTEAIYDYPLSMQVFVMNDKKETEGEQGEGREQDSYLVQSLDQQDMRISLQVQWRIDPAHVVEMHKQVRDNITERLLRPVVMLEVKNAATKRTAIDAYSGEGLVKLQGEIWSRLTSPEGELRQRGVLVDNFVIEHIGLNPEYTKQITDRQIAIQKKFKEDELTKAAEASALRAKAEAQADLNTQVVAAERDKQVGILQAEQKKQQAILAAEGSKQTQMLQATGARDAALLEAEGTLAKGRASAEAQKLQLSAYAVPGADAFVKVEVAKAMSVSMSNVKGWLPQGMNVATIGEGWTQAVERLTAGKTQ
jgi:regulator of protease activity HflC (stomatin/prohibitin superfamily)